MATKKLSRTVIEGGRCNWNKYARRYSNRRARHEMRAYLARLRYDEDLAEATCAPARVPEGRFHYDRLAAAHRWLNSFAGRPWSEVRSQIARRFDARTIAGQHIVYDHLLPSVKGSGHSFFGRQDFEIDCDGNLQPLPRAKNTGRCAVVDTGVPGLGSPASGGARLRRRGSPS